MKTSNILACAVALLICACSSKPPSSGELRKVPVCTKPSPPDCPKFSCGGNSPIANTFPINGLRPDGECNPEGVQLMPGSLTGGIGNACEGSTLDVYENELVGVRDGVRVCDSKTIQGASFVVRSWVQDQNKPAGRKTLRVQIRDVVSYTASNGEVRQAYRMSTESGSLCSASAASLARDALGIGIVKGLTDPPQGQDLVIPVMSELYDQLGRPIPPRNSKWANPRPEWINLACVDDALAKRSLYDLYTDNVKYSRAALNMLLANYCYGLHVTLRGVEIGWELADDAHSGSHIQTVAANTTAPPILEAKWDEHGAVCLSLPRLLREPIEIPAGLPDDLKKICPTCPTPDAWADKVRACQALGWAPEVLSEKNTGPFLSYAGHSPLATCEACNSDECKGRRFHSYVIREKQ